MVVALGTYSIIVDTIQQAEQGYLFQVPTQDECLNRVDLVQENEVVDRDST